MLEPGERNAITDVPGVRVGHSQSESGEPTGVTVVAPPALPAPAGTAVVNGMGELTGKIEIDERGTMETPVYLCGTHAVGIVHHAAVLASGRGPGNFVLPVVGECDDSWRADSRRVTTGDVERALEALGTEVVEGTVGAGTGMMCFDFPGGIGTASRVVGDHRVGVLLLCNFGDRERLDLLGTRLEPAPRKRRARGLVHLGLRHRRPAVGPQGLRRLALRALLGLVRVGLIRPRRLGRDRPRLRHHGDRPRRFPETISTPTSPPPRRPRRSRSTTASSPRGRRRCATARCRTRFRSSWCGELASER